MTSTKDRVDRIVSEMRAIVRSGEEALKEAANDVSEKGHEARERLTAALEHARACLGELEGKVIAGARATDRVVRDNPYQFIGAAFGLGLLIGALASRR